MKKTAFLLCLTLISGIFSGCLWKCEKNTADFSNRKLILPQTVGIKTLPAGGFVSVRNRWPSRQTEVYTERTDKGIRIEMHSFWDPEKAVWSEKKEDDDMTLFGGDHVEFLVSPNRIKDGIYYHFAVNPSGSIYHAKKRDVSWTPQDFSYDVIKEQDCWKVIFELTNETFGLPENADLPGWKVNFCRTIQEKGAEAEHTSWTGSGDFHDITSMGDLSFSGEIPEDALRIFSCRINENGNLVLEIAKTGAGKGYLQIFSEKDFFASETLSGSEKQVLEYELKNGYVPLKGLREISFCLLGEYRIPLQIFSGTVSSSGKDFLTLDKMEYLDAGEMKCKTEKFPGKLKIKNDQTVFLEQDITESESIIPLSSLNDGRYIAEYSTGKERTTRVFYIDRSTRKEPEEYSENAKLSIDGKNLYLDNKPFFLLGICDTPKTYFPYTPGFSYAYGGGYRKGALPLRGFPGKRLTYKPATGFIFASGWENLVKNHLENIKKTTEPQWRMICYEANLAVFFEGEDGSLKLIPDGHLVYEKIYKMAKKIVPEGIFSIHADNLSVIKNYASFCDALEYASWTSSYHPENMILNFGKDYDTAQRAAGNKPVLPWLGGTIPSPESRSAEEIRAGVYYTILKGGAGNTIHMGHGGMPETRTRSWSMLSMLQKEVDEFFCDLKTWKGTQLQLPEGIIGRAVVNENGDYLAVLLNITPIEKKMLLSRPGHQKEELIFTPYEPRVIRYRAGSK